MNILSSIRDPAVFERKIGEIMISPRCTENLIAGLTLVTGSDVEVSSLDEAIQIADSPFRV